MRALLLSALVCLTGCHLIKLNTNIKATSNIAGDKTSYQFKFNGTLDELPAALEAAYAELEKTAEELIEKIKKAAAAPPPGQVKLSDLAGGLKSFEGQSGVDFLMAGQAQEKRFEYVRIGVQSYDAFFQAAMEFYALAWQTTQSIHRIRELSGAILKEEIDTTGAVFEAMSRALKLKTTPSNAPLQRKLSKLRDATRVIAKLVPAFVDKTQKLVSTGQALVANAASSITNPKVVLHLDLIKKGVEDSVGVLSESGGLLVDAGKQLTGF